MSACSTHLTTKDQARCLMLLILLFQYLKNNQLCSQILRPVRCILKDCPGYWCWLISLAYSCDLSVHSELTEAYSCEYWHCGLRNLALEFLYYQFTCIITMLSKLAVGSFMYERIYTNITHAIRIRPVLWQNLEFCQMFLCQEVWHLFKTICCSAPIHRINSGLYSGKVCEEEPQTAWIRNTQVKVHLLRSDSVLCHFSLVRHQGSTLQSQATFLAMFSAKLCSKYPFLHMSCVKPSQENSIWGTLHQIISEILNSWTHIIATCRYLW